ncbi:ROK family transcriptional regulator [Pseudoruegeria sp. HB172150]|uniref:ROK family transcriptional regulator n=1 Tax=Pseudoruegeria sp. HB172150 TaxID=2721164 RepID=UPI0015525A81|nr:ROK family transcriptional regulator [Pseudoruegeria sp. HB172150]
MIDLSEPLTFNERQLFEIVLRGPNPSRATISEATGLTPTTVSRLVSRFVELGIFAEKAERSGGLGQPRKNLTVRPGQVYTVGVNFMRGRFDLAVVDLAGTIVWVDTVEIEQITMDTIAELTAERVEAALKARNISRRRLVGAGFSLPGGFSEDGEVLLAHESFPELDQRALGSDFTKALGFGCSFDTDGACAALGEFLYGCGSGYDTFFFVHIGHGVGGGAIINGKLYRGAHGNASKPGVLFPYDQPRPSGQDLVEFLKREGFAITDIADLAEMPVTAEPAIEVWLDRAAEQLADLGRFVTAFLDPEAIVIGGRLPDRFNSCLIERLSGIELPGPSRHLPNAPFRASHLGPSSGVLGAASLPVFERFFTGAHASAGNPYRNGRRAV